MVFWSGQPRLPAPLLSGLPCSPGGSRQSGIPEAAQGLLRRALERFPARSRRVYLRSRPLPLYPEHMVQGAEYRPAVGSAYGEKADA